ncbi:shikimate dehydrogenase [Kerstersia gyiorum]|jgi:shikimate dehydrogenase|uniref:shikimate dehydrogenase n=1 Tax=Kerstersia gyiorum TaxID=206506 RepID=UPI00242BE2E7|nr:shikimate dehydrogenase [Kerstersia gyiorum]MCH4270964.1 shikimate dehydrogenase [Kerstersia gyiorum]MCI1230309.1 shikimate dehydrogenase [Kerstersia gyiorum]
MSQIPSALQAQSSAPRASYLLGLIGSGIQLSMTPALHEEEARNQGMKLHYQLIDLDRSPRQDGALPELLEAARVMDFAGLNITYPCKQIILPLLDSLSADAEAMGAVNTVVIRDGKLHGHNTDGSGWRWGIQRHLPDANLDHVVLLGAGGAGAAIAHTIIQMGARSLRIVDADPQRAGALAAELNRQYRTHAARAEASAAAALEGACGLVHATPTGMAKLPGLPLDATLLHAGLWVSEIVYSPLETELLAAAKRAGCRTVAGTAMAVGQAVDAFRLFTGREPDAGRMERHIQTLIHARNNQ